MSENTDAAVLKPKQRLPVDSLPGDFTFVSFLKICVKEIFFVLSKSPNSNTAPVCFVLSFCISDVCVCFLSLLSVNCEEFLSKDESQIPVDKIFFYR